MSGLEPCLHCGGDGTEPFSDDTKCQICLGEQSVPRAMNREYYDRIQPVLEADGERDSE